MLRSFLEQPLIHKTEMEERLDAVEAFCNNPLARDELREYLNPIYDLERLLGKVSYKTVSYTHLGIIDQLNKPVR